MAPGSTNTLPGEVSHRPRHLGYTLTTALLTLLVSAAVVDGVTGAAIVGVDSATVTDEGGGYELSVTYGEVSRPALATPFDIEVRRPGGFDGPIEIAVDQEYLRMWDENGLFPAPSSETGDGEWLVWEFDPPEGDTLFVAFDARIEPAAQEGRSGAVAVLDDGAPVVQVDFTTRVVP